MIQCGCILKQEFNCKTIAVLAFSLFTFTFCVSFLQHPFKNQSYAAVTPKEQQHNSALLFCHQWRCFFICYQPYFLYIHGSSVAWECKPKLTNGTFSSLVQLLVLLSSRSYLFQNGLWKHLHTPYTYEPMFFSMLDSEWNVNLKPFRNRKSSREPLVFSFQLLKVQFVRVLKVQVRTILSTMFQQNLIQHCSEVWLLTTAHREAFLT